MDVHVIGNPVPTPEEMGEILGLSSGRVAAVRKIMSARSPRKTSGSIAAHKKVSRSRRSFRAARKK